MSRFSTFEETVLDKQLAYPEWRLGQTMFNVLYFEGFDTEFADKIRGGPLDPFYVDSRIPELLDALKERWS